MSNYILENKKVAYYANNYIDMDKKPITKKMAQNRTYRGEPFNVLSIFCPECKKMHYIIHTINKDGQFKYPREENNSANFLCEHESLKEFGRGYLERGVKLICPDCGCIISDYQLQFLEKNPQNGSRMVKSMKVFEPDEEKLIASVFITYYYPNTSVEKLIVLPVRHRIVFNYKTGQTYILQGRDLNGKHPYFDSTPEICNLTLGGNDCSVEISTIIRNKEIIKILAEELLKLHKGNKEQLTKKGDFSDTTFSMLTIYNNIPYFNYDFYYTANSKLRSINLNNRKPRDRFTYKLRTLKERYQSNDYVLFEKYLLKGIKIKPKKAIKRELFNNPFLAESLKFVSKLGFKNNDVIYSLMHENASFLADFLFSYTATYEENQKYICQFIKDLIKEKGETGARKTIITSPTIIKDTALMYAVFKKREMFKPDYFKGDIVKIHNNLSKDYKKIKQVNRVIKYDKFEEDLNDSIDGFDFELAKDTYELIDIGQELHICVGSYGDAAFYKRSIIVKMMKAHSYVGCIELSRDAKDLKQAKACFNNKLEEKKAEALKKWVEKHKIRTAGCYDYDHIANDSISYDEDKIYQGHHDYANYGMENIEHDARRILHDEDNRRPVPLHDEWGDEWDDELPFI